MSESNLVLDDAIRHLYIAIRHCGGHLLSVRFFYRGKQWEADTPEEAIRLRRALEAEDWHAEESDHESANETIRSESVWTPDTFWNFVHAIGTQQRSVVELLLSRSDVRAEELVEAIGIDESALGGVLSGLSKQLKQFELRPSHLYSVYTDWSGGNRIRWFQADKGFRLAAEEVGWPEERKKTDAASTKRKRK